MAWEENSCICLNMQLIAILSRIGVFYYPYCDCEDRAVLYSYLVRNLLKLDVVLLDYPNHIATAVCFNENVSGDFVTVEGKKYIVCDPTYIGASIGKAMPQFKRVAAKVLKY